MSKTRARDSFVRACIWSIIILTIGLLQVGITFLVDVIHTDKKPFELSGFLIDGFFLFFAISISSSIVYDYFMDSEIPKGKFWNRFGRFVNMGIITFFIIIISGSMVLYACIYLFKTLDTDFQKSNYILIEKWTFATSFIFTLGLKWLIYYNEKVNLLSYDTDFD